MSEGESKSEGADRQKEEKEDGKREKEETENYSV